MRRHTRRRTAHRSAGFTLVEVLVALALVGSAAGVAGYALQPVRDRNILAKSVVALSSAIAQARDDALRTGLPRQLVVNPAARRIVLPELGREVKIDGRISLTVIAAREVSGEQGAQSPKLLFLPDGTGSGGHLSAQLGGLRRTLRVSWLTGVVTDER